MARHGIYRIPFFVRKLSSEKENHQDMRVWEVQLLGSKNMKHSLEESHQDICVWESTASGIKESEPFLETLYGIVTWKSEPHSQKSSITA